MSSRSAVPTALPSFTAKWRGQPASDPGRRLREYHASLAMLLAVAPQHRLVRQLARELECCPISMRRAAHVSAGR
jgi:hypothetical protein